MDVLQLFLAGNSYTPPDAGDRSFDNTAFGELLDADVGYPTTAAGVPVQTAEIDRSTEEILSDGPIRYRLTDVRDEAFCVTDFDRFDHTARLHTGETVSVTDYDVLLVSSVWLYYPYLHFLVETLSDTAVCAVQEESVRGPTTCSATLQSHHRSACDGLDGCLAVTEQYRRWIEPFVSVVSLEPLPIPAAHVDEIERTARETRRDTAGDRSDTDAGPPIRPPAETAGPTKICLGVATANLDFENLHSNLRVFDTLRDRGHAVCGEFVGIKPYQRPRLTPLVEDDPDLTVTGYLEDGYYERLAEMRLTVALSDRGTSGRYFSEFAACGVPCVGSRSNEHQTRCWPDLTVDPYDTERAVELAERLLTDASFYREQTRRARTAVRDEFDAEETCAGLETFLRRVRAV